MTWDRTLRIIAWGFFCLMWIPIGWLIWYDSSGGRSEGFEERLMMLFVVMLVVFISLLFAGYFGPLFFERRERRRIRTTGTLVPATILKVSDTRMYINHQPVLSIGLSVRPSYEPAFEATIQEIIPLSAIPQVQPGKELQVYHIPGTTRIAFPE